MLEGLQTPLPCGVCGCLQGLPSGRVTVSRAPGSHGAWVHRCVHRVQTPEATDPRSRVPSNGLLSVGDRLVPQDRTQHEPMRQVSERDQPRDLEHGHDKE